MDTDRTRFHYGALGLLVLSVAILYGIVLGERVGLGSAPTPVLSARLDVRSSTALLDLFRRADYRLDSVLAGRGQVPPILVERMPSDLARFSAAERKRLFVKLVLPLVLYANERIASERQHLLELRRRLAAGRTLAADERAWLDDLRARYDLETLDLDELVRRVDVIPPSLALAQAAEESGWGTSRFVREGNAVFGQYTYREGTGIVPRRRDEGRRHEIKAFGRLYDSVVAYMRNLNTHYAYDAFRRQRARQREAGGTPDGYFLAGTLERYSERGQAYIETIRTIIRANAFEAFDDIRLADGLSFAAEPGI